MAPLPVFASYRFWPTFLTLALCAFSSAKFAAAAPSTTPDAHPVVPGFERFFADGKSDPKLGGRLLLGELNCTSCHQPEKAVGAQIVRKTAPVLSDVGSRIKPDHLRAYIAAPHQAKPGTTMPDLFSHLPAGEAQAQVEAIVQFLTATGIVTETMIDPAAVKRGDVLFHQIGCVACHNPRRPDAKPLTTAVPLGDPKSKYTVPSLTAFLQDPHKVRPSARMPAIKLTPEEARDVAHYLLNGSEVAPNFNYAVYKGKFSKLPKFDDLKPSSTGQCVGLDTGVAKASKDFAIRFTGFLQIANDAEYTFFLKSDDGSKLYVDGLLVVDNDGVHPANSKDNKIRLTAGVHPIVVEYFQDGAHISLSAEMQNKGKTSVRQTVDSAVTLTNEPLAAKPNRLAGELDFEKVTKGRELFASVGCASCHQLKMSNANIASKLQAKPLKELTKGGCLADKPADGIPNYRLNARQQTALTVAIGNQAAISVAPSTPQESIARTMLTFNCYACHSRDKIGGVEPERDDYFTSKEKEMGDEGRIPPDLNGAGDKLNLKWIGQIINSGGEDRPYMLTRMPRFGASNVGPLPEQFEAADLKPSLAPVKFEEPDYRIESSGRFLVGAKSLSCIKCHDFDKHASIGIRAMNLTRMSLRLREDWFHRYLLDPQAYRPGTRMPGAFPGGITFVRDVLGGDAHKQIESIWIYLSAGGKAAVPVGLVGSPIELVPDKEPIVYRNFISDVGPRAIGVGYPEKVNVAWDAQDMRLGLIWHGAFIDAAKHWTARGQGFQGPSGDHALKLIAGVPFAALEDPQKTAWPGSPAKEQGYQFRGYKYDTARRPQFMYTLDSIQVTEDLQPVAGKKDPALLRTITLESPTSINNLYFRAVVAKKIEPAGEGWYTIDNVWKMHVDNGDPKLAAIIRPINDKFELIIPVPSNTKGTMIQEFVW